jgi:hypothetical protein
VRSIVWEELPSSVRLEGDPISAAEELLCHPRAEWVTPSNAWEQTVVALAVALARIEGGLAIPRARALNELRFALDEREPSR